ncbi:hypothetical protein [Spirosoma endophyticum]|uniref:Por secretion system C-terminal sorting domain-containing protein n=1 Tax=Spirosoma endophyticum TaxID=662367 RepID=A0A1I1L6D3_9BACT|nr:hypothetical protein [Spirosoma endophyticum]SFC68614.1 hypothetical protein SAMN05216167_102150 [Spirosoma endophyticum]
MKINHSFDHYKTLFVATVCLLSASSIQAQTFTGQADLSASPTSFEAVVYPVASSPTTIRINFNNRTNGAVRVVIRGENGKPVYEEFESIALYRRRFDFASMPAGTYTIELSKKNDLFTQTFSIEPPTTSHITMTSQPVRKTPETTVEKKLIVSQ